LAKIGFDVTGVDISETALQIGQELASQQNLKINFVLGDVLELENLDQKFDVIYDSHCLHCIVFEEDRQKVLVGAKKSLTQAGIFILDTMVIPEVKYDPTGDADNLLFDEDFILWHKTKPSTGHGIIEKDGQHWCAQRRIYPPQKVLDEVAAAGLTVIFKRLDQQKGKAVVPEPHPISKAFFPAETGKKSEMTCLKYLLDFLSPSSANVLAFPHPTKP
jgi:SAM-dependent methyltransferase